MCIMVLHVGCKFSKSLRCVQDPALMLYVESFELHHLTANVYLQPRAQLLDLPNRVPSSPLEHEINIRGQ